LAFLARRSYALDHGFPILAKFMTYHVVGVEPRLFGKGPAVAIPGCLKKAGITTEDVDLYEINEAFANVAMYAID
jgi:acetyl-CoA acyltransferase 1